MRLIKDVRLITVVLLAMVFGNGLLWARVIPFDGGPDEYNHFGIPKFYVENGRLPVFQKDGGTGFICRANGVDCSESYSMYANYGYFVNAWTMVFLGNYGYQGARIGSVLLATLSALLLWEISRKVFKGEILTPLTVTLVAVMSPSFTFFGSFVNAEIPGIAASLALLLVCWTLFTKEKIQIRHLVFLGIASGFLALSRLNYYPMFLMVPWVFFIRVRKYRVKITELVGQAMIAGIVLVLVAGWWFLRNWILYKDFLGVTTFWNAFYSFSTRLPAREMGIGILEFFFGQVYGVNWFWSSFRSFVGVFGYMNVFYPEWVYQVGAVVALLAFGRVALVRWRKRSEVFFWIGILAVALITFFLSALTSWVNDFQPQGRYWFVVFYPFVLGVIYGITNLVPGRVWKNFSSVVLVVLVVILNIWGRNLITLSGGL